MSNQLPASAYYLIAAVIVCGFGGFGIATLSAMYGSPLFTLATFYIGLTIYLLLNGPAAATLARILRGARRGKAL
jgi:hypothetical protein